MLSRNQAKAALITKSAARLAVRHVLRDVADSKDGAERVVVAPGVPRDVKGGIEASALAHPRPHLCSTCACLRPSSYC